ncbi:MAG TPA: rhomboid family intramembrane serine protease, partial [Thermoanaerobaculia bacterium]|nr:rhomboid family intramembrane serine protease [Thermoanaerobaculia bacterium]
TQLAVDGFASNDGRTLRPSFDAWAIKGGSSEVLRLVTATLLHGGVVHVVMNVWMLLQLGTVFEFLFGSARLFVVYWLSGVIASATSVFFLEPHHVSVGASGAIFGVAGGLLVLIGAMPAKHRWALSLRIQIGVWSMATLILGFVSPAVDNAAHVGGLIAGSAVALMFRPFVTAPATPGTPSP